VKVEHIASARDFLDATSSFRSGEPVLTNLIGSVATGVVEGRRYDSEAWIVVRADDGDVVGCAIRTAPWPASLSPMPDQAAVLIGAALAGLDPAVDAVTGPVGAVRAVLTGMGEPVREVVMTNAVHVLRELAPLRHPCAGWARSARVDEIDDLVPWLEEFAREAGVPSPDARAITEVLVRDDRLLLWEVDGEPAAMAGHAPTVPTPSGRVGRIGPVYTPVGQRRHGFGAAVTSAVAVRLLRTCSTVMLFADVANPDSNSVYSGLGFEPVAEIIEVRLMP
jgi:hypothetical protein